MNEFLPKILWEYVEKRLDKHPYRSLEKLLKKFYKNSEEKFLKFSLAKISDKFLGKYKNEYLEEILEVNLRRSSCLNQVQVFLDEFRKDFLDDSLKKFLDIFIQKLSMGSRE